MLLLLSLFGQAVAGSAVSCQMENDNSASTSQCAHMDMQEPAADHINMSDAKSLNDCELACDCCLGACSSSASLSWGALSLSSPSIIKTPLPELALLTRSGSLYRPPITR